MKRIFVRLCALALCLVTLSLCACSKEKYEFKTDENGNFVHPNTNVTYNVAPACYEALGTGETVVVEQGFFQFYEVNGSQSQSWLYDRSVGMLIYDASLTLPTLLDMNVREVRVEKDGLTESTVTASETIAALKSLYLEGESVPYNNTVASLVLSLRFCSADIDICYVITYIEYAEDYIITDESGKQVNLGKKFLYNRYEERCVAIESLPEGVYGIADGE